MQALLMEAFDNLEPQFVLDAARRSDVGHMGVNVKDHQ